MKEMLVSVFFSIAIPLVPGQTANLFPTPTPHTSESNIIIVTTDGFRWQEVFAGADPDLLHNDNATPDTATMDLLFGGDTPLERRKKLLPFFWTVIAQKGQLYGNRYYQNKVNVSNAYAISYPGYNELFTGTPDNFITNNKKNNNPNINVLEYLNDQPAFHGKVAVFTSWDVFPYIFNQQRNDLPINSGYDPSNTKANTRQQSVVDSIQQEYVFERGHTRLDDLTFITAKEYLKQHRPRVTYLALGETDEYAHDGRYDLYLQQANTVDRMIAELWHWVQTTPGYKDNTTLIITTDHGRGRKDSKWSAHNNWIGGSSEVWLAVMGPGIDPLGEVKKDQQLYQKQLAGTIAALLGEKF